MPATNLGPRCPCQENRHVCGVRGALLADPQVVAIPTNRLVTGLGFGYLTVQGLGLED